MTTEPRTPLLRLAALAGVAASYRDAWDQERRIGEEALRAVLAAMGFATRTDREIEEGLAAFEAEDWRALLPPTVVLREDRASSVPLTLPERLFSGRILWSVTCEDGTRSEGVSDPTTLGVLASRVERDRRHLRLALPLAALPLGYHRLVVAAGYENAETLLVVTPRRGHLPSELEEGRPWGVTAQLHSIRSARNWGMGDYRDLAALADLAGGRGASVLGINPLHALFPAEPRHISPYSPSTRLFLNPLYLDVEAVPEFAESAAARAYVESAEFTAALAAARTSALIDHVAVAALKWPVLRLLYGEFAARHLAPGGGAQTRRGEAFRRFVREGGNRLEDFGRFNAIHAAMLERSVFSWRAWPGSLGNARSGEVRRFAEARRPEIELHHYLEWEGERQLGAAASGFDIRLYRDLAVGVDPAGADAWAEPALFSKGATVGAPPDLLNLKGQNWGLAPLNPVILQRASYAPFIAALRANMRHAGVLRVDHAMALKHLYWVPDGASPEGGAYVAYPFEDLLGILALESRRNGCAVIGEDLGTVPMGFSGTLNGAAVLSYRLMLFERGKDGRFLPPNAYPRMAAAGFSTHDIATLKGFWLGTDLAWRRRLRLYPNEAAGAEDRAQRRRDRRLLLDALVAQSLLGPASARHLLPSEDAPVFSAELAEAVHRFLGRSTGALALVQAEDALGEEEQANLPGTVDQHPNWRRKLSLPLEAWGHDGLFVRVLEALDRARRERVPAT